MKNLLPATVIVLALSLSGHTRGTFAQTTAAPATSELHYVLEVRVLGATPRSSEELSQKSFTITKSNQPLHFELRYAEQKIKLSRVRQPHLLFVTPYIASQPALLEELKAFFANHWLVSVEQIGNAATPYCIDATSLSQALSVAQSHKTSPSKDLARATAHLEMLPGRRVLFLDAPSPRDLHYVPKGVYASVRRYQVETYLLDGGVRRAHVLTLDPVDREGYALPGPDSVTSTLYSMERNYNRGIVHEVKRTQALKDILTDQENYYELDVDVPPSAASTADPIVVAVNKKKTTALTGLAYTIVERKMGSTMEPVRVHLPAGQRVIFR